MNMNILGIYIPYDIHVQGQDTIVGNNNERKLRGGGG